MTAADPEQEIEACPLVRIALQEARQADTAGIRTRKLVSDKSSRCASRRYRVTWHLEAPWQLARSPRGRLRRLMPASICRLTADHNGLMRSAASAHQSCWRRRQQGLVRAIAPAGKRVARWAGACLVRSARFRSVNSSPEMIRLVVMLDVRSV
jgi:hypothetical protein